MNHAAHSRIQRPLAAALSLLTALLAACGAVEPPASADATIAPTAVLSSPAPAETIPPDGIANEATQEFSVLIVNVGKADAIVIRAGDVTALIDTGSSGSVPQLFAALNLLGVSHIDALFLTHNHDDHTGGLTALAANYEIGAVYGPLYTEIDKNGERKLAGEVEALGLPYTALAAWQTVSLSGGVVLTALGPLVYNAENENDNSLVLRLTVGETSFLFAGDMEFSEEQTLLGAALPLDSDFLKVANHGNPDATGDDFAAAVSPSLAVISTDTSVDRDSANARVFAALDMANVLVTEDFTLGVLVELDPDGHLTWENPPRPDEASPALSVSFDVSEQSVTIRNGGDQAADLSGMLVFCEPTNAALRLPNGLILDAGNALLIQSGGALSFSGDDTPLKKKKVNTVTLYSAAGIAIDSLTQ